MRHSMTVSIDACTGQRGGRLWKARGQNSCAAFTPRPAALRFALHSNQLTGGCVFLCDPGLACG